MDLFAHLLKMSPTFTTGRRHNKTLIEVNTDEGVKDNSAFVYIFAFSKLSKFYFYKQKKRNQTFDGHKLLWRRTIKFYI